MYGGELPLKNKEYTNDSLSDELTALDEGEDTLTESHTDTQDSSLVADEDYPQDSLFPLADDEYAQESLFPPADESTESPETFIPVEYDESISDENSTDDAFGDETAEDSELSDEDIDADEALATNSEGEYIEEDEDSKADENTEESIEQKQEPEEKLRRVDAIFDFMEIAIFSILGMFLLLSFFFRYTIVDGDSMMNTLQNGERLILTSIFYSPEQGDIVVVQDNSTELKFPIVKRIIAVGGQTVKVTRNAIYVDTILLEEPYVYTDHLNSYGGSDPYRYSIYPSAALLEDGATYVEGSYYEIYVPEGYVFLMGDHRNCSKDSRDIGLVHEDAIMGKAIYRFFPFDKIGKIE